MRLPGSRSRRVPPFLALLGALLLLLLAAPTAMAGYLTPDSGGSPNADDIHTLYTVVFVLGMIIFAGVMGVLVYSLVKYRYRRGAEEPAQIRGNTPLEIGWTVGAASILVILTAVTFVLLGDIKNPQASKPGGLRLAGGTDFASVDQAAPPGGKSLRIRVNGQQYLWRYDYPGDPGSLFSYYDLVVPLNTTVTLRIQSSDVAHSWWIPELGGKADAIPGHTNETWFRIDGSERREFVGECAELCGEGHADMRARVIALPPDEYEAWTAQQKLDIKRSAALLALSRRIRNEGR